MKLNKRFRLWAVSLVCGITFPLASLAIVGGSGVNPGHWISRSTVMLVLENEEGSPLCTGSFIGNGVILTAAHCVVEGTKSIKVFSVFGAYPLNEVPVSVEKFWYDREKDVALIFTTGNLPKEFDKISLLPRDVSLIKDTSVIVAGYGQKDCIDCDPLRSADLKIQRMPEFTWEPLGAFSVVYDPENRKCIGDGDSGGPAFVQINGRSYIWGVASRGDCPGRGYYYPLTSPIQEELDNVLLNQRRPLLPNIGAGNVEVTMDKLIGDPQLKRLVETLSAKSSDELDGWLRITVESLRQSRLVLTPEQVLQLILTTDDFDSFRRLVILWNFSKVLRIDARGPEIIVKRAFTGSRVESDARKILYGNTGFRYVNIL